MGPLRSIGELIKAEQEAQRLATRETASPGGRGGKKNQVPDGNLIPPTRAEAMPGVSKKQSAQFKQLATPGSG